MFSLTTSLHVEMKVRITCTFRKSSSRHNLRAMIISYMYMYVYFPSLHSKPVPMHASFPMLASSASRGDEVG